MSNRVRSVLYHLFATLFGLAMIYPLIWTISSSLKPENEILKHAASLIPSAIYWENYAQGWRGFGNISFDVFFANSAWVAILVVLGTLVSSPLVAFGFARLKFSYRKTLFACLIATVMLPAQVTLIPQYMLFHGLGWVNTFLPLIVPAFVGGTPFFIFLLIQFIRGIPRELDQAAVIDGCTAFGIFLRVILPLTLPALATVTIFAFYWTWDDFMTPLIYLNDTRLFTVSLGLRMFSDPSSMTAWGPLFAMSVVSILPQLVVFFCFQKFLVQGLATTGIKG